MSLPAFSEHSFPGFDHTDFDVFVIPDFESRLSTLRATVRPKLVELGELLATRLGHASGLPLFPHASHHAQRRTNPPEDSWAALARSARGYQRYAHFAVGIEHGGVYVRLVVKAASDDKKRVAGRIARSGLDLLAGLPPDTVWYDSDHPTTGIGLVVLTDADLMMTAARLQQRKTASMAVGFALPRALAVGPEFAEVAYERCLALVPLYRVFAGE